MHALPTQGCSVTWFDSIVKQSWDDSDVYAQWVMLSTSSAPIKLSLSEAWFWLTWRSRLWHLFDTVCFVDGDANMECPFITLVVCSAIMHTCDWACSFVQKLIKKRNSRTFNCLHSCFTLLRSEFSEKKYTIEVLYTTQVSPFEILHSLNLEWRRRRDRYHRSLQKSAVEYAPPQSRSRSSGTLSSQRKTLDLNAAHFASFRLEPSLMWRLVVGSGHLTWEERSVHQSSSTFS